VSFASEDWITI